MGLLNKHEKVETSVTLLFGLCLVTVTIGGIVEIVPLFYIDNTIEDVEGVRPYTPLELEGREVYLQEGCYVCHSQMIRALRDEVERYGHYSLAAESKYDHPFQWGSKRTGPDLARVGGRYTNEWHTQHLTSPQSVVPESVMPRYDHLLDARINVEYTQDLVVTHKRVGVPYTDEMIENVGADFYAQLDPFGDTEGLMERYGENVTIANFDGQDEVTKMDALIAYLQVLGTMVDFDTFEPDPNR